MDGGFLSLFGGLVRHLDAEYTPFSALSMRFVV